jgi:molybdopterin converting factor small subunit
VNPAIQICLFGSLQEALKHLHDLPLHLDLKVPAPLSEVLQNLQIPLHLVQVAMVNFRAVSMDSTINPGDRVSLFPKEYPIFADWKDFRLPS